MKTPVFIPNLEEGHPFRQWQTWEIPHTDWTIKGYSRSGDKTCFCIPQLQIVLDAGLAEGNRAEMVFLTHTHDDHVADIEYLSSKDGVTIFAPKESIAYLDRYITARRELNHSAPYDKDLRGVHTLVGVEANQFFYWGKNQSYRVEIFNCVHSIPCVGFGFSEKRKRLLPELDALKKEYLAQNKANEFGALMAQKRKQQEEIEETYYEPLFAFLGDTTAEVFVQNPSLLQYQTIMVECTFLKEEHLEYAEERRHNHWQKLKPIVEANPNCTFALIHFSLRYSDKEVLDFFKEELENISNVRLWLSEMPLLQPQHQKK